MITLELTNDLLYRLIAISTRIEIEETNNHEPNYLRIYRMRMLFVEVNAVLLDNTKFNSPQKLTDLWNRFYPIYQDITNP